MCYYYMKTTNKKNKKTEQGRIDWKRLIIKALENGAKKAIEVVILALVLGATLKMAAVAIPAAMAGTALVKMIKVGVLKV